MRLNQLSQAVPALYESRTAVHLIGPPGCGKSSFSRQAVDTLSKMYGEEFGYVDVIVPTKDAPDIQGFLVPHKNEDGTATSYYTEPDIIRAVMATGCDRGILMLDEFKQGEMLTAKALAQLILDHKIGNYNLPEGWWIMMASNRTKDNAGANRMMSHIVNRVITLQIDSDVESWSGWAVNNGMHPMGMGFVKSRPGVVFSDEVPGDPDKPFCTPRSFTKAMGYLSSLAGVDEHGNPNMHIPNDPLTNEVVSGFIGEGAAAELFSYLKVADILPTIQEMLANPEKVKLPPGDRIDAQYAVVSMCTHYADGKTVDKLWTVVERLVKELQTSAALTLIEKSGGVLMNSKALGDWIVQNRALIVGSLKT